MRRRLVAVVMLLAMAAPALAQERGTLEGVEQTFARWLQRHGIVRATLAVARRDRLVLARGYGGIAPGTRALIGSLSKAITATCVLTLVQDGKLRLDTSLGEILSREPRRYPDPRDRRLREATVVELLTHRAGFGRVPDPVTGPNLSVVLGRRAVTHTTMQDLVPGVLQTMLENEPGEIFAYTNASHLLLGIVIEAVTGQPYEDYCRDTVLKPQGIRDAALHPTWALLGSYGGWNLSSPEYLAFLRVLRNGPPLNAESRQWMLASKGKETTPGGPLFYSLMFVRPVPAGGHNFFHYGNWDYRLLPGSPSFGVSISVGTFAASLASGVSWSIAYEPNPSEAALTALDRDMHRAVAAVSVWPETDLYPSFGLR